VCYRKAKLPDQNSNVHSHVLVDYSHKIKCFERDNMVESKAFDEAESSPFATVTHTVVTDNLQHAVPIVVEPMYLDGVPIVPLESDEDQTQNLTVGAGVAGGVLGLLLGGPVLAILAGFGTAYATQHEGATGDAARAVGLVALETKEKARELDAKHNLAAKAQDVAADAWEKAKELDRKHNILVRTKEFLIWSWETVAEQNRKHHLLERAVNAVGTMIAFTATKIGQALKSDDGPQDQGSNTGQSRSQPYSGGRR